MAKKNGDHKFDIQVRDGKANDKTWYYVYKICISKDTISNWKWYLMIYILYVYDISKYNILEYDIIYYLMSSIKRNIRE